jgi:hypothetical protein
MATTLLAVILLVIVVVILALLLALYLIPVTIEAVAGCSRESASATAIVAWGILGARARITDDVWVLELLLINRPVMTRDLAEMITAPPAEGKRDERRLSLPVEEYLGAAADLWPHLRKVIAATLRSLYLEVLRGEVTLGLESPASTGTIYGYCTALRYVIWPVEAVDLVMTPVFDHEVFEGSFTLRMQIRRPLLIIIPAASALLQKPVRQRLRQISGRGALGA